MKSWVSALFIFILTTGLLGCSTTNYTSSDSSKAYIGMFSGAIIGGLSGSAIHDKGGGRLNYIAAGALLGALIGGGIGMILDEKDQMAKPKQYSPMNEPGNNNLGLTTQPYKASHETTASMKSNMKSKNLSHKGRSKASQPQKAAQNVSMNEKIVNMWHNLPSTQWFFDDGQEAEVG